MRTYNLGAITKALYDESLAVLSRSAIRDTINPTVKPITLSVIIRRLIQAGVLTKLERGKYLVNKTGMHEFTIANFLYQPSYVSFESALHFHGILPQTPYEITSATTKKPVEKIVQECVFRYRRMQQSLYWGYTKSPNGFLIADAEKALLDLLYVVAKGYGALHADDLVADRLNRMRLGEYANKFPRSTKFQSLLKELNV